MAFTWYDAHGRKVNPATLKTEQASPNVRAVRRNDATHPAAGLTPVRLSNLLRDSIEGDPEPYLALAEDMEERNEHYAGVLGTRKRQVAGLQVTVEAAGDDARSVEQAELVRGFIEREAFYDELFDILDAIGKGFSCTEILWDTSESQWQPTRLCWRDPRWFEFDHESGEIPLLRTQGGPEPLRPYKWIFHKSKIKSGLPIRGGLARGVAWTFLFKSFSLRDWSIFCETYGQPLRLGKHHEGASESDKDTLLDAVTNIGTDFAAIVPQSMVIEFVGAKLAGNHELYEKRADWLDRQVSKLVLGQTGTTDAIAGGYATGTVHNDVREDIETADARQLSAVLNRDLAIPMVDLNFGPQKAYPKIGIARPDQVDVKQLVENVAMLVPMGLKVGMATMRGRLGLPEPGKDEDLLIPPRQTPSENPGNGDINDPPRQTAASNSPGDDAVGRAVDTLLAGNGWEPLVEPVVRGLEEELATATSEEEARAILDRRRRTMDVSMFTDVLARLAFAARLAGEAEEEL